MIYPSGTGSRINRIFERLYSHFGPQHWWPADSSFEVIIGAILTQNTSWSNVEKAISAIKKAGCLNPRALFKCPHRKLARLIKSAGYYNLKAKRLRSFFEFFFGAYSADISRMGRRDLKTLRRQLLEVKGIGPET
ncbi:MAG: endonuclease III domain-containing protein, partial [Candidatus Omnitrophica bacterium]|nr:endonuclease III domain-containing protein [Candidatus Omnitrophota bacterium]